MSGFAIKVFLATGITFLLALALGHIQFKRSSLNENKLLNFTGTALLQISTIGFILSILLLLNFLLDGTSAFENCMARGGKQIDPEAIEWMQDYCANNS